MPRPPSKPPMVLSILKARTDAVNAGAIFHPRSRPHDSLDLQRESPAACRGLMNAKDTVSAGHGE